MRTMLTLSVCSAILAGCISSARCSVATGGDAPARRDWIAPAPAPAPLPLTDELLAAGKRKQPAQPKERARRPKDEGRADEGTDERPARPWIPEPVPGLEGQPWGVSRGR